MKADKLFFAGLKAVIEKDGKVLVLNDSQMGPDLLGGKIQDGETDFLAALKREVKEETGLKVQISEPFSIGYFKFPDQVKHRHAGKEIFLVFFKAKYISGEVTISDEHNKFDWFDKDRFKKTFKNKKDTNILKALGEYFNKATR